MKVFELMNELSKVPAGAEVRFSMSMSVDELITADPQDCEGKICYGINVGIESVDVAASEKTVFIYH